MSDFRWQYEGGETQGSVPIPGSNQYKTEHMAASQRYVRDFREPTGRVYPFNNGNGWQWCAVTYGPHSTPITKNFSELTRAKRHVEELVAAEPSPEVAPTQAGVCVHCHKPITRLSYADAWKSSAAIGPLFLCGPAPDHWHAPAVAPRETQTEEFELFLRTAARSELVEYIRSSERGR